MCTFFGIVSSTEFTIYIYIIIGYMEFPGGLEVKESAFTLLWFGFNPWPGTSTCHRHDQKKKRKEKRKKKGCQGKLRQGQEEGPQSSLCPQKAAVFPIEGGHLRHH